MHKKGDGTIKAVVLLSGGVDSTVCLALVQKNSSKVLALTVDYGQRHWRQEVSAARKVIQFYPGVSHEIISFSSSTKNLFKGSSLIDPELSIPQVSYSEIPGVSSVYVPFRNGVLVTLAAAVAYSRGYDEVYFGAHAGDQPAYPDAASDFIEAIGRAVFLGTGCRVTLRAPLIPMTKVEIVRLGLTLGAPLELTWSCYLGGNEPCGVCPTCRERLAAFKEVFPNG